MTKQEELIEYYSRPVKIKIKDLMHFKRVKKNKPTHFVYAFDPVTGLGTQGVVRASSHLQAAREFVKNQKRGVSR